MRDVNHINSRVAAITLNVICITYYNIMPLIIGGAAESRGLLEDQLGFAAAAFMLGLALVNFAGVAWLRRYDWRKLVLTGNALAALAFALPILYFSAPAWILCNLLAGVTRAFVLEICARENIPAREGIVSREDAAAADEMFLTNSLIGIMPVKRLDGKQLPQDVPATVTRTLMNLYAKEVQAAS